MIRVSQEIEVRVGCIPKTEVIVAFLKPGETKDLEGTLLLSLGSSRSLNFIVISEDGAEFS
jgi:hypothetical protein